MKVNQREPREIWSEIQRNIPESDQSGRTEDTLVGTHLEKNMGSHYHHQKKVGSHGNMNPVIPFVFIHLGDYPVLIVK